MPREIEHDVGVLHGRIKTNCDINELNDGLKCCGRWRAMKWVVGDAFDGPVL